MNIIAKNIASIGIFTDYVRIIMKGHSVMKIVVEEKDKICALAAQMIVAHAEKTGNCAMAFAAGRSTQGAYEAISEADCTALSGCTAFTVCEYEGLEETDSRSCAFQLEKSLYKKAGISTVHTPTVENADEYDDMIKACGGLKLAVLGIGTNGHIGFNEPATAYDSYTHEVLLTDKTKMMKAEIFGGVENVPEKAVTMGLKTICSAENVILIAFGSEKAEIVHQLVYGKTSTYVPAAMLQMHMNMTLLLDPDAAAKL